MTTTLCALALAVFIVQVTGEVDKRSISTLARTGQLPGKRYIAALAKNGEYPRPSWNKKYSSLEELAEEDPYAKRFLGSLARSGDLRTREEKRTEVDGLVRDMEAAERIRRLRLDALKEELIKDGVDEDPEDDKTALPDKRSVEALARIGLLKPITTTHDFTEDINDYEKKISSDEFEEDKRGGISSLARNGWNNKRTVDEELEELMNEVYGIGEKRNVASLARGFNLPGNGKRSEEEDEKRNIASVMRDMSGKRDSYTNNAIPFVNDDKRNVGALARNWDRPYIYKYGKREVSEEEKEEVKKRYVATLLRDGPLPVGPDANTSNQDESQAKETESMTEGREDQSLSEEKGANQRSKKEASEEDTHSRKKRETFISPVKDELAAPSSDIEFGGLIGAGNKWADDTSPLNRRYFGATDWLAAEKRHIGALARGGWLPRAYVRSGRQPRSVCMSGEGRWEDDWWPAA